MSSLFDTIAAKRGILCENCSCRMATQLHHCLYHRRRGATYLDVPQNLELLCNICHANGYVNSWKHRVEFYIKQCYHYDMAAWNESLPLKIKQRFV